MALKLTPISRQEAESIVAQRRLQAAIDSIQVPTDGKDGATGARGRDGRDGKDGKDGITTTVVKEVLANKERLLDKDEFDKFKKHMLNMENDIRNSLGRTHGYFPGGGGESMTQIANVIEVSTDTTITTDLLLANRINVILVTVADITVTLPAPDATRIVWVQQGYTGTGTFQVCRT